NLYNYSAFGKDSPFGILHQMDGKIAVLDIGGDFSMTFYHYIEEMENAPNRYHKIFKGPYIDNDGIETIREFNLYARILEDRVVTDVKPMEDYIWENGLYAGDPPGIGSCLHLIKANIFYDITAKVIREGRALGMLYRIGKAS
ncbi:MAG: AAC(3) family N-acetyltransferase, partial [Ignavibacteria bacterium]